MAHWLLVERLENWEVDRREGFLRFGLPENKRVLAGQIKKGDILIFYISSGISKFADVREATADGTTKLAYGGDYDTGYPLSISTLPRLSLNRDKWVSLHGLVSQLTLTSGKRDWRQIMRTSLRRLDESDANIIIEAMKRASKGIAA